MKYEHKSYYIFQNKPQYFDELVINADEFQFAKDGLALSNGIIKAGVYACLSYDKRRVITLITDGKTSEVINLIMSSEAEYAQTINLLRERLSVSPQDSKLISYARSISEKLRSGIEVSIFDAVKEDDFIICPACGVKNAKDSGFPFCLECGEPL